MARAGGDLIVRAGWKSLRWRDPGLRRGRLGAPLDLLAALSAAEPEGVLDRPVRVARKRAEPLALRLVAFEKPPKAAAKARTAARKAARKEGCEITGGTLAAAEWVILVTTLTPDAFPTREIGELYRARWRIELAFKRLKSLVGLAGPPGADLRVAKTWILAHLLMVLLLEPHVSAPEISPRLAA